MGKKVNMIGKRFDRLLVLAETPRRSASGSIYYLCRCDCGKEKEINGNNLRAGETHSCGCYNREVVSKTDPVYKTKLYSVYQSMKMRCNNPSDRAYHNYGARGIKIAAEWQTFKPFQEWALANGYEEHLWLDRIDNNKGYSPDNCRWATPKEQQNNKRTCRYLTVNGETKSVTQWAEEKGINNATLYRRLELGWNTADLFKPVDKTKSHGAAIKNALRKKHKGEEE